jgi:methylglutamate dehydrogenase subunit C
MTAFRRLERGGRIDRSKPVSFTFDGKPLNGFAGDTLASALLANGKTLTSRSFKYHRPRGIVSAGVEEPNGLFTIGQNEPNIPATTVDLTEGLAAKSQNAWPSPDFDLMAVNSLLSPMFQSGFYYKTFMGPFKKSWMFYEPFIRRAAGLGKGSYEKDLDRYDTAHEFCDVLVVGSGPAGLAAALAAGRSGARVVLVEQDSEFGGQLLSERMVDFEAWRKAQVAELASLSNVKIRARTTAQGFYDDNFVVLLQRHEISDAAKGKPRQTLISLRAKSIVFATGALERPLVFSNNDRPGVMLASAARTYLNRFAVAPLKRVCMVTNNDTAYLTAFDLAEAGIAVTMADHRKIIPSDLLSKAAMLGMAMFPGKPRATRRCPFCIH